MYNLCARKFVRGTFSLHLILWPPHRKTWGGHVPSVPLDWRPSIAEQHHISGQCVWVAWYASPTHLPRLNKPLLVYLKKIIAHERGTVNKLFCGYEEKKSDDACTHWLNGLKMGCVFSIKCQNHKTSIFLHFFLHFYYFWLGFLLKISPFYTVMAIFAKFEFLTEST